MAGEDFGCRESDLEGINIGDAGSAGASGPAG